MTSDNTDGVVEHHVSLGFQVVLERIERAVAAAGLTVFARIDHAAAAEAVGLSMPPTVVLVYGNARGGTPLMLAAPALALDLPLRVLVREADHGATVSFHPAADLLRRAGLPEDVVHRLDPAQRILAEAVHA